MIDLISINSSSSLDSFVDWPLAEAQQKETNLQLFWWVYIEINIFFIIYITLNIKLNIVYIVFYLNKYIKNFIIIYLKAVKKIL